MAGQKITFNPAGLFTNVNSLGKIPPGGLLQANNTVISKPGIIESRRGRRTIWFTKDISPEVTEGLSAYRLLNAKLRIGGDASNGWLGQAVPGVIVMLSDGTIVWSSDGDTFTEVVPILGQIGLQLTPVEGDRHWYAFEQNGTIYISTISGVIAVGRPVPNDPLDDIDRIHSGYYPAGVPAGLSMSTAEAITATPTAVGPDSQVAYHFCFGYRDASGITHLGAPTTRATFVNVNAIGGAYKNVELLTTLPPGINPNRDFFQVYRSLPSPGAGVDPGDDCGLIYEGQIPRDSHIDQMARAADIVTARTTTPHGYLPGQYVNLLSPVDVPGGPNDILISVYGQLASNGLVGNVRQVNTAHGNAGVWTALAGSTFNIVNSLGTVIDPSVGTSVAILLKADKFTNKIYYMESYSPWVYVLDAAGNYLTKYDIGCLPLLAAYDEDRRQIRIVGIRNDKNKDENLSSNGTRMVVFETDGNFVSSVIVGGTLPAGVDYLGNPAPITADILSKKGKIGLFRKGLTNPTIIALCVWSGPISMPYFAWSSSGLTWIITPMVAPVHDPGFGTVNRAECTSICSTYIKRAGDGSYLPYFGINVSESVNLPLAEAYCETYYLYQTTGVFPLLGRCTFRHSENMQYLVNNNIVLPQFISLSMHPVSGRGIIVHKYGYLGTPNKVEYRIRVTSGTFAYLLEGFSPFVATDIIVFNLFPATYEYAPFYGVGVGVNEIQAGFDSFTGLINGSVNEIVLFGTFNGANTVPPYTTAIVQVRTIVGLTSPKTFVTVNGPWPLVENAPEYQGGSTLSATTVNAGIYKIINVIDTTHFTFSSPGTPFTQQAVAVDIRVTSIGFTDAVYPIFIGPYLYTSPVQEGAIAANRRPPLAKDITIFRTYAFYANCTQPASVKITLLSPSSITTGDRLFIGSSVCSAATTENAQTNQFKVFSTGPANFVKDVQDTIASIANVVNTKWQDFGCTILPVNTGVTDFASFFISAETFSGVSQFANKVSFKHTLAGDTIAKTTAFAPYDIIVSPEAEQNVIYYSKSNIPDAVPFFNSIRVGQDSKPIRRILASRDSLFIFKDDGCFILRGYEPPWQVDPYDLTLHLSAIDSLSRLDNALYGLFTRGIFRVSDSSVELLSLPIQDQLERYMAGDMEEKGNTYGFGLGDNADHKYLMWMPTDLGVNYQESDIVFVYDTYTQAWTRWTLPSFHAISYNDIRLMFAGTETIQSWEYDPDTGESFNKTEVDYHSIMVEQKSLTDLDLNDGPYFATAINLPLPPGVEESQSTDGSLVYAQMFEAENKMMLLGAVFGEGLNIYPAFDVKAGDYIEYAGIADSRYDFSALILEDANPNQKFAVSASLANNFTNNDILLYRVYRGIRQTVMFAPSFPESPAASNHFSEYALSFRKAYWDIFHLLVTRPLEETDLALPVGSIAFEGIAHFGLQHTLVDGVVPTTYPTYDLKIGYMNFLRTYVPRDQQRGTVIFPGYTVKVANSPAMVDGIYIVMTPGPTSFTRR